MWNLIKKKIQSKLKIFNLQRKNDFALINNKFKNIFKKNKYLSKLTSLKLNAYKKIRLKIKNNYAVNVK